MSKELNCKWYFGPQPRGNEKGANNPTALTFKGTKYHFLLFKDASKTGSIRPTSGRFEGFPLRLRH